jgi:hypothetical protein
MEKLPTTEQTENSVKIENKFITDHQKVFKELEPLVKFIDFWRISGQVLADIIEPLEIIPVEIIMSAYRYMARSNNSNLNNIRGIPQTINESDYVWDESGCGSKLIIENDGKVVRANGNSSHQNVRAKMILVKGIFEWDVIIEKWCNDSWIGVCASENFDYENFAGNQPTGWALGSSGNCWNSGSTFFHYCPSFGVGTIITVHLDMNKRSCAFTVNGTKYPEVSEWDNLSSKLYPVVSLKHPGRFRIQPHQKI